MKFKIICQIIVEETSPNQNILHNYRQKVAIFVVWVLNISLNLARYFVICMISLFSKVHVILLVAVDFRRSNVWHLKGEVREKKQLRYRN